MTQTRTASFDLSLLLHVAAAEAGRFITGDVRWMVAEPADLARLSASDRELIHVVTGERLDWAADEPVETSFFTWQIICDRATGELSGDVSVAYVEALFTDYELCVDGSPMSDDVFDLALAYLVGRDLRVDPDFVWV